MHAYHTHTCGALRAAHAGYVARRSGWVHAKRDHGGLLFIDLRDHDSITQCVFPAVMARPSALLRAPREPDGRDGAATVLACLEQSACVGVPSKFALFAKRMVLDTVSRAQETAVASQLSMAGSNGDL